MLYPAFHPDKLLVFSYSRNKGYTRVVVKQAGTQAERDAWFVNAGFPDGVLYYFENPSVEEGYVGSYWSGSPEPGSPVWPSSPDAPGPVWAWVHSDDHFKIEVSRKGPVEHIRYLAY